jgi:hypothetical protein
VSPGAREQDRVGLVADALAEVAALEKAALGIVEWNNKGGRGLHLDAARGYDLLSAIAKESGK